MDIVILMQRILHRRKEKGYGERQAKIKSGDGKRELFNKH